MSSKSSEHAMNLAEFGVDYISIAKVLGAFALAYASFTLAGKLSDAGPRPNIHIQSEAVNRTVDMPNFGQALGRVAESFRPIPTETVHEPITTVTDQPTKSMEVPEALRRVAESFKPIPHEPTKITFENTKSPEPVPVPEINIPKPEIPRTLTESEQFAQKAEAALADKDYKTYTWNFLRARGYSEITSAAIMGNVDGESNFSPIPVPTTYKYGALFGGGTIFQHIGGRYQQFQSMYPNGTYSFKDQLDFGCYELEEGKYQDVLKTMQATDDLSIAVRIFQDKYEKPSPQHANFARRERSAFKYLEQFSDQK
ncbi:hypothetical protein HGB24_03645 [Candidatus Saccharibacteria bacterium]|nr:hypothetical protein [Candidatus Saccharibacteria bacterium]